MKEDWLLLRRGVDADTFSRELNCSRFLVQLMRNRGLTTLNEMKHYLFMDDFTGYSGSLMKDMDRAVQAVSTALASGKHIRITGDYDVDGVTSTTILLISLRHLAQLTGSESMVDFDIPDRVRDGYGLNHTMVDRAAEDGVELIITCDNGISAFTAAQRAEEHGIGLVITDHHEPQGKIPVSLAAVDPHRKDDHYPFSYLCGAGVAYRFLKELYKIKGCSLDERQVLPFVSLATVCDMVSLTDENRYLAGRGLQMMRHELGDGTLNPGLTALINSLGLAPEKLTSTALGFSIGPAINAGGRLENAKQCVTLFTSEDSRERDTIAEHLVELNLQRKDMTRAADALGLAQARSEELADDRVLVLFIPECHESVVGLVAGDVKKKTGHPAIVFTRSVKDPDIAKGSGRSIDAYNMFEKLSDADSDHIFTAFGGHAMAAGMSLPADKIPELRKRLNENCCLTDSDLTVKREIDIAVDPRFVTVDLVTELGKMEPFGKDNKRPLFAASGLHLRGGRIVGQKKNCLWLFYREKDSSGGDLKTISFTTEPGEIIGDLLEKTGVTLEQLTDNRAEYDIPVKILFRPKLNEYRGSVTVEYMLEGIRLQ